MGEKERLRIFGNLFIMTNVLWRTKKDRLEISIYFSSTCRAEPPGIHLVLGPQYPASNKSDALLRTDLVSLHMYAIEYQVQP